MPLYNYWRYPLSDDDPRHAANFPHSSSAAKYARTRIPETEEGEAKEGEAKEERRSTRSGNAIKRNNERRRSVRARREGDKMTTQTAVADV